MMGQYLSDAVYKSDTYSEPCRIPKIECFAKIAAAAVFIKRSILAVPRVLNTARHKL